MMRDEQKDSLTSPFKAVLSRMTQAARGRRLGDEFALTPWEGSSTVEPVLLWVKASKHFVGLRGVIVSPIQPSDRSSAVALTRQEGAQREALATSIAIVRGILQSRLISWYLHDAQDLIALAELPWPLVDRDLADQLRLLIMQRDRWEQMERSLSAIDASIERVIVEIYELEADDLMILDLLLFSSQNQRCGCINSM